MRDLAADLRFALDPVAFAKDALRFSPDPWQEQVLRSTRKRLLLNCCRQSGKSSVAAILGLHCAMFKPEALVLLVSPSLRQSGELFRKVTSLLSGLSRAPRRTEENRLSLTFENGSRVVSLPSSEHTVRGFSRATLIVEDEAAWVTDDLYHAIRPMLAVSNGRLVLMSTPNGKRGHFHREWISGGDAWERIMITALDVPRISREFIADERRSLGPRRFAQEYLAEFSDTEDQVFSYDHVTEAVCDDASPLGRGAPPTDVYVGLDLGQSRDHSAIAVVDRAQVTSLGKPKRRKLLPYIIDRGERDDRHQSRDRDEDVYVLRHVEQLPLRISYPAVVERVHALMTSAALGPRATLVVDATGVGRPVVDLLQAAGLHPVRVTITGGDTTTGSPSDRRVPKRDLIGALQVLLQQRRLKVASDAGDVSQLTRELLGFRVRVGGRVGHESYDAEEGAHDDLVLALALACWQARDDTTHRVMKPIAGVSEIYADEQMEDAMWVCGPSHGRPAYREELPVARFIGGGANRASPPPNMVSPRWAPRFRVK